MRLPLDRKAAWDALKSAEQGKVGDRAKVTDGGLALAAMLEMIARGDPNGGEAELEALLRERWPPPAWIHPAYPRALLEEDESRRTAIRAARARRAEALAANGWQETEETRLDGAIARWLSAWDAALQTYPLPSRPWPGIEASVR